MDTHQDGPESIPKVHLPSHEFAAAPQLRGGLLGGVTGLGGGIQTQTQRLQREVDGLFVLPVVENLAPAHVEGETLLGGIGLKRVRLLNDLEGRDEISHMTWGTLRGE